MILGIDYSLTSTGLAVWQDGFTDTCTIRTPADDGSLEAVTARHLEIADRVEAWADLHADDTVVIEAPLEHAPSRHRSKILGGWWAVAHRVALLVDDPVVVVPPRTRAKYATGDGGADKAAVVAAVRGRYPMFDVPNDDVADAVVLVAIGARLLGQPIDDPPAVNLTALRKL